MTTPPSAAPAPGDLLAALAAGAASIPGLFEGPLLAQVVDVCQCDLAAFPEAGSVAGDDMTANVLVPLTWKGLPLTAAVSFEPEAAFGLLRRAARGERPPLERYRALGADLVRCLLHTWLEDAEVRTEAASLVEDSAAAALLGTHAPGDTTVVCARIALADEDAAFGGVFYLLSDPKPLATITDAAA